VKPPPSAEDPPAGRRGGDEVEVKELKLRCRTATRLAKSMCVSYGDPGPPGSADPGKGPIRRVHMTRDMSGALRPRRGREGFPAAGTRVGLGGLGEVPRDGNALGVCPGSLAA
jgi:hypothetical protein